MAENWTLKLTKAELIEKLEQIDPNGVWSDADNMAEFGTVAEYYELAESYARFMAEGEECPLCGDMVDYNRLDTGRCVEITYNCNSCDFEFIDFE